MSEWVDFCLYSLQAVLLWIALPRCGSRFLRPAFERASATDGAPPGRHATGGAWMPALQVWGVLSLMALLACRLGRVPPPLSADRLHLVGWEALLKTSNVMLVLGALPSILGARALLRRLKSLDHAGSGEPALLRSRDDFLPRSTQYLVYALTLASLVAGPAAELAWPLRVQGAWGNSLTGLAMALLLFVAAAGSLMRAPNAMDLALGEDYRRLEIRACYLLMGCLALLQLGGLALELAGASSRRHVALLISTFVSITLAGFALLLHAPNEKGPAVSSRP
ncbi:MAG: hypothetical protein U1F39_07890 [Steroidobacteraceae bacterium]